MERHRDGTKASHEENNHKTDVQRTWQEVQISQAASPPPSSTSSPSHEFSFTISLHPSHNKTKSPPTPPPPPLVATIDLSPADEIFLHGHLLPLHLHSNNHHHHAIAASSSRSSTESLDSITSTLKDELLHDDHRENDVINKNNVNNDDDNDDVHGQGNGRLLEGKVMRGKSRSFSHILPKWRKYHSSDHHHRDHDLETDGFDHDHHDHERKQKIRKSKFAIVKRYMRMVKPFIPFRHKRAAGNAHVREFFRQPASFNSGPGSLAVRKKKFNLVMVRGRRSGFSSAPVSIRTSPTHSGVLVAGGNLTSNNYRNDSTVEELQAAIRAAIAHCKKSNIAGGDKEPAERTAT